MVAESLKQISEKIENLTQRENDKEKQMILDWFTSINYSDQHTDFFNRR